MRHGSLFSGIGGFDLAAQWMGWENVFQVEWDRWCQKVLAKNFPDALRFGDIKEFNDKLRNGEIITDTFSQSSWFKSGEISNQEWRTNEGGGEGIRQGNGKISAGGVDTANTSNGINLGRIDILTGGFPCQPFSHAGKRKGTDDSRYLWPEMLETIRILKPSFVVGENVAGLVSMENGKTLDRILSDLADEGYTTEQFIIPACAIGAWHRRDRIWIVGRRNVSNTECDNKGQDGCGVRVNGERRTTLQTENEGRERAAIQYRKLDDVQRNDSNTNPIRCNIGECPSKERNERGGESFNRHEGLDKDVSYCDNQGLQGMSFTRGIGGSGTERNKQPTRCNRNEIWHSEPSVGRVANGIPNRVDRLKGLGNAIVPQIAFEIFKAIENYETQNRT